MVVEIIASVALLIVGIIVLAVIHVCMVGRAFRRFGHGGEQEVQRGTLKEKGLSPDELKRLPCLDYKAADKEEEGGGGGSGRHNDCAVCLESFNVGEKCRLLPNCHHCFHAQCIDLWLMETPFCPICRTRAEQPKIQSGSSEGNSLSSSFIADELA
ncbi:hypothetical protein Nepgr_023318 [Nepenthes gracilis]|uniref:RING-type domain-containing protein n=1 Tax=Nepenthes gracilis TaxID=150966 RepID=A0AAD3T2M1_NEPGR|nr:hypothetical protein Nepgr_023318 [Nepenthes gracilis]